MPNKHFEAKVAVWAYISSSPNLPEGAGRIRPNKHFEAKVAVWAYISFSPNLPEGATE